MSSLFYSEWRAIISNTQRIALRRSPVSVSFETLTDIFRAATLSLARLRGWLAKVFSAALHGAVDVVEISGDDRDNRDLGPGVGPRLSHMKPRSPDFSLNRQRT